MNVLYWQNGYKERMWLSLIVMRNLYFTFMLLNQEYY